MVGIIERPRPALSPSAQARLELIQRITQYAREHPKKSYTGGDVSLASGRDISFLSRSIGGWEIVADVIRRYRAVDDEVVFGAARRSRLSLGVFIDAAFALGPIDPKRQKAGRHMAKVSRERTTELAPSVVDNGSTADKVQGSASAAFLMEEHPSTDGVEPQPGHELGPLTLDEPEILHLARALRAFYLAYQLNGSLDTNGISISQKQFQSIWADIIDSRIDEIPNLSQVHAGLVNKLLQVVGSYDLLIAQNPPKTHMLFGFFEGFHGDRDTTRLEKTFNRIFGVVGFSSR